MKAKKRIKDLEAVVEVMKKHLDAVHNDFFKLEKDIFSLKMRLDRMVPRKPEDDLK